MRWTQLTVKTLSGAVDAVCGILYETGVSGVNIEDASVLEDGSRMSAEWDILDSATVRRYNTGTAVVKAFYPPDADMEDVVLQVREGLCRAAEYFDVGEADIQAEYVREEDWENNWKQYYKPVEIGKKIYVKPEWEDTDAAPGRDIVIALDPGMAFGTGTHETTRMCLELLEEHIREGCRVLDIGTGSGILAIAAVKLGAGDCMAVDIDANAVRIAERNAELNGIGDRIRFARGDLAGQVDGAFDIITANIIAGAIMELAPDVPRLLNKGGVFIASGIIKDRYGEVKAAIEEAGMSVAQDRSMGDWVSLLAFAALKY